MRLSCRRAELLLKKAGREENIPAKKPKIKTRINISASEPWVVKDRKVTVITAEFWTAKITSRTAIISAKTRKSSIKGPFQIE